MDQSEVLMKKSLLCINSWNVNQAQYKHIFSLNILLLDSLS